MWVAQNILTETATQPVFVLREIIWPPDLEDRHALRRLAVTDKDGKGPKWTVEADAVRVLDGARRERLRYTRVDFLRERDAKRP